MQRTKNRSLEVHDDNKNCYNFTDGSVFYICYFAKLISQKKQGIKTDQLGKGKEGFVKFIEVALKIITYLLPVIQIISIVFYSGTAHIVLQFRSVYKELHADHETGAADNK